MLIHDYLEFWARDDPDRVVYDDGNRRMTYGELDAEADAFAEVLVGAGLTRGDRIAAVAKNRPEWLSFYFGSFKCGVVPVPLNARQHPREWLFQLNDAGARWCFAEGSFTAGLDEIREELTGDVTFVCFDDAPDGWRSFKDELASHPLVVVPKILDPDTELYQMYTSGTTGRPKGAVLTHRAVDANVTQSRLRQMMRDGERLLTAMPLFHAGAAVRIFQVVAGGATVRLMGGFDEEETVRILAEEQITVAGFVPAMIQRILDVPGVEAHDYPHLRTIAYGSSPISPTTLSRAMDVFGCGFYQAYGQTETTSSVTGLSERDHRRARDGRPDLLKSCGRPHAGTEVEIVDEAGRLAPVGAIGEIRVRGPQMMSGYWNRPEANAETLRDGWLHTGDVGYLDDEGYLYLADRKSEVVISGSENIYPKEIEDILSAHPAVAEVAVIGVPDDRWGEVLKAFVVRAQGHDTATEQEIIDHCLAHLARYKLPKSVEFRSELPRTATGKVRKHILREPYWKGRDRSIS